MNDRDRGRDRYDRGHDGDRDLPREDRQKDYTNRPGRTEDTLPDRDSPPRKDQ